jgi:hypothetical protein
MDTGFSWRRRLAGDFLPFDIELAATNKNSHIVVCEEIFNMVKSFKK